MASTKLCKTSLIMRKPPAVPYSDAGQLCGYAVPGASGGACLARRAAAHFDDDGGRHIADEDEAPASIAVPRGFRNLTFAHFPQSL